MSRSVNDGLAKSLCSLNYVRVDIVVSRLVQLGQGALMAKIDIKVLIGMYQSIPVIGIC